MPKPISLKLTILLACIFAISPLAIDTYLPAVTNIASDLKADSELVSLTVSLYVLGLAFGQLIGGPLSDKYGRRKVIISGLSIFALASCLLASAQSIELLWLYRIIQALGGGVAAVCVPAIIRDHVAGAQAAKLFSFIALMMMLAPALAPSLGTLILTLTNWHGIFIFLAFFSTLIIIAIKLILKQPEKSQQNRTQALSLWQIVRHPKAIKFLLAQAFGYSVLMIFLANSPLIYMEYFNLSSAQFSLLFSLNVAVIIIINRLNSLLLNRYQPHSLLKVFFAMQLLGGLCLLLSAAFFSQQIYLVVIGFALAIGAISGIGPNAQACYLNYFEQNAGSASAVFGFTQYASGATLSALSSLCFNQTLWPASLAIFCCALISWLAIQGKVDESA
ncbi:multidrug effflux MFS transporter [Catenovulum sp. 2E275]|uniref:multidrug effflux MFS transporter n=1 Tax=Catenovulum sp. 2E275 TaxID=2980497 RepID=UPI0021D38644|nr:multidrug effflux MFS transporter [Catenovulum sp. 2E275]MCU4676311.1 multidrug effflux MFS transporter [Catenovulum sp. 2E275]